MQEINIQKNTTGINIGKSGKETSGKESGKSGKDEIEDDKKRKE